MLLHNINQCQQSVIVMHTVNPGESPWGLIYKNEFLGGGLFEGRAYARGAYFSVWNFLRAVAKGYQVGGVNQQLTDRMCVAARGA